MRGLEVDILIQIGPGERLSACARSVLGEFSWSSLFDGCCNGWLRFLQVLQALFERGQHIDFQNFYAKQKQKLELPTYPFQRQQFSLPAIQENRFALTARRLPGRCSILASTLGRMRK